MFYLDANWQSLKRRKRGLKEHLESSKEMKKLKRELLSTICLIQEAQSSGFEVSSFEGDDRENRKRRRGEETRSFEET